MNSRQEEKSKGELTAAHEKYGKALNVHAYFKVHNQTTSDDLVQDTFLKTWSYLVKGGKIDVMKSFLYHVLNYLIIDEYRKRKTISLDMLLEKGFEPSIDNSERLFNNIDGKTILLLIQRLPIRYQKVMRLRFVQDLSLKEISLITGQTKNTSAVQLHRGIKKLKQLYENIAKSTL